MLLLSLGKHVISPEKEEKVRTSLDAASEKGPDGIGASVHKSSSTVLVFTNATEGVRRSIRQAVAEKRGYQKADTYVRD